MAGQCTATGIGCCETRRRAMQFGEMIYRAPTRRWYFPVSFIYSVWPTAQTRFAWTFCPFCGGDLPDTTPERPTPFLES